MSSYLGNGLRARLAAWLEISRTMLRLAAPAVDVLVRLSLAKAFFAPEMLPSGLYGAKSEPVRHRQTRGVETDNRPDFTGLPLCSKT